MKPSDSMLRRVEEYLGHRRSLGFALRIEGDMLLNFARFADKEGHHGSLTCDLAVRWARLPARADRLYWARRIEVLVGFARYCKIFDSRTEIPPRYLFGPAHRRKAPYIYSCRQLEELLSAARGLSWDDELHTYFTLFGLLSCTGLRISEALRSFFRYVSACEGPDIIAEIQRIMAIPMKRFARPLLGFLSQSEMQAILEAMDNSWSGRRDHLLFLFLYNTGARVSEALGVRVQDVQRNDYRAVQLVGKGRKQRMVPLWKETAHHIRAWLKLAGLKPDQSLLPNRFGGPMTRTGVQQRLQLHIQRAQTNCPSLRLRRISPHTIRHATAMNLLQSGVTAPVIALWLGHEDPATTHQYIEADLLIKEQALRRLHAPRRSSVRFRPRADLLTFLDSL